MSLIKEIGARIAIGLGIAAILSGVVTGIFAILAGAAWFAFGNDAPPFPWSMLRFFLFVTWCISAVIGLTSSRASLSTPTTGEKRHD